MFYFSVFKKHSWKLPFPLFRGNFRRSRSFGNWHTNLRNISGFSNTNTNTNTKSLLLHNHKDHKTYTRLDCFPVPYGIVAYMQRSERRHRGGDQLNTRLDCLLLVLSWGILGITSRWSMWTEGGGGGGTATRSTEPAERWQPAPGWRRTGAGMRRVVGGA